LTQAQTRTIAGAIKLENQELNGKTGINVGIDLVD
jgi:ABC-type tungstate transport system substrate-binding protein